MVCPYVKRDCYVPSRFGMQQVYGCDNNIFDLLY